jgi:nitroreductase family protein
VITGVPWRTGWRYRERGYRHVYWDAGTMLAQLLAAADSAGLSVTLYTRFPDAQVAALTGADQVHEVPVAVVALGETSPALEAAGPAVTGDVDAAPVEFPLVTAARRAGPGTRRYAVDPAPPTVAGACAAASANPPAAPLGTPTGVAPAASGRS